ncbi:MAG TPA: hypothetical protein VFK05_06125 [Polyangiaceae bacterium]|nr:hypothetical protein [Polyangiaceae bacterium]
MLSPFETYFVWATVHARARTMENRLAALSVQMELLGERLRPGEESSVLRSLETIRAELGQLSRETRSLGDTVAAQLPSPSTTDLETSVRDTLAPLRRYLDRRETRVDITSLPSCIAVAAEPELVRAALATTVDVLLAGAISGEVLRFALERDSRTATLIASLETQRPPPSASHVENALAPVAAWLMARTGLLTVSESANRVAASMTFPLASSC